MQKDTNYRVEFRTANSNSSSTAIDVAMLVTNNLIDLSAITSGTGSPFIVEVGEDGNPTTTLAKATSWFSYNTSSLEEGIWSNMLYQDFRTPNVFDPRGDEDCNVSSEVSLLQETDCVYQYDYPSYYYLNIGTGFGSVTEEYGTMQFRISRISEQSLGGMSRMSMDSEASFYLPVNIDDPVSENGSLVANKLSVDGEIHFAGDVDWYVPRQSATACSFSAAGRDLDGDTATNDSASGLSMRLYVRNFGERVAPNNRGSFRTSLSGVLTSGGEEILEVTGTRAGGYKIIVTCEAPPAVISNLDQSGRLSYPGYDDYPPSRNLNASVAPTPAYGMIDMTGRTSRLVTGTISYLNDGDSFEVTGTPGRRYSITLSSVAVNLSTPGHPSGNTARLQGLILDEFVRPYARKCRAVSVDGVFQYNRITNDLLGIAEFDDDDNPANTKADLGADETCMFITVDILRIQSRVGGYRITVRDEGVPPHPARADAQSPLMYDAEDVYLLGSDSPGMSVFITRETYTDGDGVTYSLSSSIGSIASTARIDSYDDIDLFRRECPQGFTMYSYRAKRLDLGVMLQINQMIQVWKILGREHRMMD